MLVRNFLAVILVLSFNFYSLPFWAQQKEVTPQTLKKTIESLKSDPRGPYQDIRWYCKDGTTVAPQERCPQPGGVQHARLKPSILELEKSNGLYLGQILTGTDFSVFWDDAKLNSRIKQYQLEKYLKSVDNGWIQRKSQYYRGAIQVEDEEAWGVNFYQWLLNQDKEVDEHFYLIRQSLLDIPHKGDNNLAQKIRSVSKTLSEEYPAFMNLRIKLHGQPEENDIEKVKTFKSNHATRLSESQTKKLNELLNDLDQFYQTMNVSELKVYQNELKGKVELQQSILDYLDSYSSSKNNLQKLSKTTDLMWEIRKEINSKSTSQERLAILELSLKLEEISFKEVQKVNTETLVDLMSKINSLTQALAATGAIEIWEYQKLSSRLTLPTTENIALADLTDYLFAARSAVEWGVGMTKAVYKNVIDLYSPFEPLANGFIDDRIRASIGLALGESVGQLNDLIAKESGLNNAVFNLSNQGQIRGLNPGYAKGELVVIENESEDIDVSSDKIYIFQRPPSDLKPIAGIATVSEGNLVSHVQLLARNLGIPNAVLSDENMLQLKQLAGQVIFYSVSPSGAVIMKLEKDMSPIEKDLFVKKKERNTEKIEIEEDVIRLDQNKVLNLRNVNASESGKSCGPKAANLGQLKAGFPENVVEGLVMPFGIFKAHMDQKMPEKQLSYWQFLTSIFEEGNRMRENGSDEKEADAYELAQLQLLRSSILKMPFLPEFVEDIEMSFLQVLGKKIGNIPVFLRSDTNMEDLKDFTGAGLNLTIFNAVDRIKIYQGIREVWASPYSERSYKWRQKYLSNPTYVFPSILIIPSVNVDYSGVLITKGITNQKAEDLTVAFSRGAGGAVEGQSAETRLINTTENILISPSRDLTYNNLPITGGSEKKIAAFNQPILNEANIQQVRALAIELRKTLPFTPGISSAGPYDVELGFKEDKLWLFQVRPFVENKKAQASTYLESISPNVKSDLQIPLTRKL